MGEALMATADVVDLRQFREKRARDAEGKVSEHPKLISRNYEFSIGFNTEPSSTTDESPEEQRKIGITLAQPSISGPLDCRMVVRDLFETAAWMMHDLWQDGDRLLPNAPMLMIMMEADGRISIRWPRNTHNNEDHLKYLAQNFSAVFEMLQEGIVPEEFQKSLLEYLHEA